MAPKIAYTRAGSSSLALSASWINPGSNYVETVLLTSLRGLRLVSFGATGAVHGVATPC